MLRRARGDFVEKNNAGSDRCAEPDQTPVDIAGEDALGQRGNQTRLRCRQRIRSSFSAQRPDKTVGVVYEIKHWRNYKRACDDTENERDLLPPRCRIDKLTGLEVLEIVVRDRRHVEDDRGSKQCEGDQRFADLW